MSEVRDTRGRILFAGEFDPELIAGIEQPTHVVQTLFDIIGELATSSAKENVDAIVINDNLLHHTVTLHLTRSQSRPFPNHRYLRRKPQL